MVVGKVKAAMGFQRSSGTAKAESTRWTSSTSSSHKSSPGSVGQQAPPTPLPSSNPKTAAAFVRSFGVYFPRASAQVRPRPSDVAELLRLVEELQERESRLRTQLLEQKILRETVSIVPFLEKEIADKNDELARAGERTQRLEAEKRALHDEVEGLSSRLRGGEEASQRREKMIADLEAKLDDLRMVALEQGNRESWHVVEGEVDECSSSSQRFQGLIDVSARSNLLKNFRRRPKSGDIASLNQGTQKSESGDAKADEAEAERPHQQHQGCEKEDFKPRDPRVPNPPPSRTTSCNSSTSSSSSCSPSEIAITTSKGPELAVLPPIPPPATLLAGSSPNAGVRPPPPPPPPPTRGSRSAATSVRRVPEVVEFYHSLMRRDSKRESSCGGPEVAASSSNARDMIGEIENRSSHLLAIKTDVETQGDFIRLLIKEVEHATFINIEDVVAFVKWLDDELSFLVYERAVLKHFNWPEHKADAMREAAFGYCDLKKLESEASSFRDDPRQLCAPSLKKMQALLEKLEQVVHNLFAARENATHRYKRFGIPCEWMQEKGCISQQIKLASVILAMKYMKRVSTELEVTSAGSLEEEELMLQGVRFAFRVHQFAGGFDVETMKAFQELKDKARILQSQNHCSQQKLHAGLYTCRKVCSQATNSVK